MFNGQFVYKLDNGGNGKTLDFRIHRSPIENIQEK